MTTLLLAHDFPPMGGGIARLHGEVARRYPRGELIVSTPQDPDAADVDAQFGGAVDRLPVGRRRTKSLPGLLLWSRRAASLARQHRVQFVYCGNVKPAGYPARWVYERTKVPYCIFLYGADLLSEQHKYHHSGLKRRSTRASRGGAAALVAISQWTRDLALTVLGELALDGHGQRLRVVHLGTDPARFHPGVDSPELLRRLELPANGARWLLTVARLEPHKGVDTVLRALPAILEREPDVRYAVAGAGSERDQLEKLAAKMGVGERVRFLGEGSRGSVARSSRRRRADCRWSRETRAGFPTRCATAKPGFWCPRKIRRHSPTPSVACSATPRWPSGWGPRDAGRSRPTTTGIAWCAICGRSKPRCWRGSLGTTLLLAFNFPPLGGGIARWMGELALRYPPHSLLVSTGRHGGSETSDPRFPQPIDHTPIRATRLRTLNGLALWTARASALVRRTRPGFGWCAELKPAGYPARWLRVRYGLPYGVIVHGTELLLLQAKIGRSRFKRWTARALLGGAAVVVANSRWTAELARSVLGALDLPALAVDVRVVPLGTTPSHFRPGIDPRPVRERYGLDGGPWLLTVSRLDTD